MLVKANRPDNPEHGLEERLLLSVVHPDVDGAAVQQELARLCRHHLSNQTRFIYSFTDSGASIVYIHVPPPSPSLPV